MQNKKPLELGPSKIISKPEECLSYAPLGGVNSNTRLEETTVSVPHLENSVENTGVLNFKERQLQTYDRSQGMQPFTRPS